MLQLPLSTVDGQLSWSEHHRRRRDPFLTSCINSCHFCSCPPVSLGGDNEFQSGPQIPSSHPPPPGSSISRSPAVSTTSPFPLFYIHGGARWRTGGRSWLLIITGRLLRAAQRSINQQRVIKCVWNECRQRTCRATHTREGNGETSRRRGCRPEKWPYLYWDTPEFLRDCY